MIAQQDIDFNQTNTQQSRVKRLFLLQSKKLRLCNLRTAQARVASSQNPTQKWLAQERLIRRIIQDPLSQFPLSPINKREQCFTPKSKRKAIKLQRPSKSLISQLWEAQGTTSTTKSKTSIYIISAKKINISQ